MSKKLHSKTIKIGKKHYPIKVSDSELKILGDIEKSINQRIIDFLGKYKNLELEDALAMILIEFKFRSLSKDRLDDQSISGILDDIEAHIESVQ